MYERKSGLLYTEIASTVDRDTLFFYSTPNGALRYVKGQGDRGSSSQDPSTPFAYNYKSINRPDKLTRTQHKSPRSAAQLRKTSGDIWLRV